MDKGREWYDKEMKERRLGDLARFSAEIAVHGGAEMNLSVEIAEA